MDTTGNETYDSRESEGGAEARTQRRYAMGDKGKKMKEKGQKQKMNKQNQEAKKKQEKQTKRTP